MCKLVAPRTASYYSMPRPELLHEGIWQRPQIARAFLSEHLAQSIREPLHNRTQSRKGPLQYVPIVSSFHSCLVRCLCVHSVHPCTYLFIQPPDDSIGAHRDPRDPETRRDLYICPPLRYMHLEVPLNLFLHVLTYTIASSTKHSCHDLTFAIQTRAVSN